MIFRPPELPASYLEVIASIEEARNRLRFALSDNLNRWTGFLARMSYARVIHGSNTMEGVKATLDDAVAIVDGEPPADPQDEDWQALAGHRHAMDYVIQLSRDPGFTHNEGTLLALHFMMMKYDLGRSPGRYRPGPAAASSTKAPTPNSSRA